MFQKYNSLDRSDLESRDPFRKLHKNFTNIDYSKFWSEIFISIVIALSVVFFFISGYGFIALGIFIGVLLRFLIKKNEDIFLLWFIVSPIFSIDSLSFLRIDTHPILTFDRVVIGALFVFFLTDVGMKKRKLLPMNKIEISMIIFSLVILYSIIAQSDYKITATRLFIDGFLFPFIVYYLAKNLISSDAYFQKFINILVIIASYLSVMGIFEYLTGKDLFATPLGLVERVGWVRINGPYKTDGVFGVNVTFCLIIILFKLVTVKNIKKTYQKGLYAAILFSTLLALFFNFYRGIWVAFIIGVLSWLIVRRRRLDRIFYFSMLFIIFVIIPNYSRLENTDVFRNRISNVGTIEDRLGRFGRSFEAFKKNPIGGVGLENYEEAQHNTFLWALSEMGLMGFFALLMLISMIFLHIFRYIKSANNFLDREFSAVTFSIAVVFLISWLGQNLGYFANVNTIFYAIVGLMANRLWRQTQPNQTG